MQHCQLAQVADIMFRLDEKSKVNFHRLQNCTANHNINIYSYIFVFTYIYLYIYIYMCVLPDFCRQPASCGWDVLLLRRSPHNTQHVLPDGTLNECNSASCLTGKALPYG